jgi:hypothetical protein
MFLARVPQITTTDQRLRATGVIPINVDVVRAAVWEIDRQRCRDLSPATAPNAQLREIRHWNQRQCGHTAATGNDRPVQLAIFAGVREYHIRVRKVGLSPRVHSADP